MAFDAEVFMRIRVRGTPSWPGDSPETGYVGADRSDQLAKTTCRRGGPYVFDADAAALEKPVHCAQRAAKAVFAIEQSREFGKCDVLLRRNCGKDARRMSFDPVRTVVATLRQRARASRVAPHPDPPNRRGHADTKPSGCGTTRNPAINRCNHSNPQIFRQRLSHCRWPPPSSNGESHRVEPRESPTTRDAQKML